jgi:hypothetical protein
MTVRYFEGLEIWTEARRLTAEIYRLTKTARFSRDFGLAGHDPTRCYFNHVEYRRRFRARWQSRIHAISLYCEGSCGEVRSQVYIAYDQGYLVQVDADQLIDALKRL